MTNQNYVSKVDSLFAGDDDYKRVTGRYPWEPEQDANSDLVCASCLSPLSECRHGKN